MEILRIAGWFISWSFYGGFRGTRLGNLHISKNVPLAKRCSPGRLNFGNLRSRYRDANRAIKS